MLVGDIRFREDLSSVVDMLLLKDDDMKYLSMVNFLPRIKDIFGSAVTAQKHEWLDDAARAEVVNAGASGGGLLWDATGVVNLLTIQNEAMGKKLRVGDVLLLPLPAATGEVVIVKSIAADYLTISVYARGHGSSTATAQGTVAFAMQVIGNAQIENADPLTADHTVPTANYNYSQIFEDVAEVSGTVRRSKAVQGDYLDYSVAKKLKESLKSLNRCLLEGLRDLDGTNKIGTLGGLREFNATTSNVAGALTLAKLYTALEAHVTAGLFPSAIHGSPATISDIEQLFVGNVRYKTSERRVGISVAVLSALGYEMELHMDKHVRSSELHIIDYNRVAYGPLEGGEYESGEFAAYPILQKLNGKQIATQILGEYTMRCSNGGSTRAYGIT